MYIIYDALWRGRWHGYPQPLHSSPSNRVGSSQAQPDPSHAAYQSTRLTYAVHVTTPATLAYLLPSRRHLPQPFFEAYGIKCTSGGLNMWPPL